MAERKEGQVQEPRALKPHAPKQPVMSHVKSIDEERQQQPVLALRGGKMRCGCHWQQRSRSARPGSGDAGAQMPAEPWNAGRLPPRTLEW